jgi:HAD superfamily hydrolase (TIGR01484 family)
MKKDKVFLMFSDLDNTITPTDEQTKRQFARFAVELKKRNNVELKFCPISGRDVSFITDRMKELSEPFEEVGLKDTVEIGAGEQGGVIVHKDSPQKNKPITWFDEELKKEMSNIVNNSKFSKLFEEEKNLKTINVFSVTQEHVPHLPVEEKIIFYKKQMEELQDFLNRRFGSEVQFSQFWNPYLGVLEVVPNQIGKEVALRGIFEYYQKKYNIVGFCYCGDHENDLRAIDYVCRLAEVPGIKAHVFIPKNAQECTKEPKIKVWQDKMGAISRGRVIKQGDFNTLKGILDVMKKEYRNGRLISERVESKNTVDDMFVDKKNKRLNTKSANKLMEI